MALRILPRHACARLLMIALLVCGASQCKKKSDGGVTNTRGILLRVTSTVPIDSMVLQVRNEAYTFDTITEGVVSQTIGTVPLEILLTPSAITASRFHVFVKGSLGGVVKSRGGGLFTYGAKGVEIKAITLTATFVDADGDGFQPCAFGPECDCNDARKLINPFTAEICGDGVDNNCSGLPVDEGCTCTGSTTTTTCCTSLTGDLVGRAGIGACSLGTLTCANGAWSATCDAGGYQSTEVPSNFIDDDCNGSVDEGSPCTAGQTRSCHRGFVDAVDHPDVTKRLAATELALGECQNPATGKPYGLQTCSNNGTWGTCQGDHLPSRNLDNGPCWQELAAQGTTASQCDGLDNDCDGQVDEETFFDADHDTYTACGTCKGQTTVTPRLCDDDIDCDDQNASVHPSAEELCGNDIDEDCRCDHDPNNLPLSNSNSVIGKSSKKTDGTSRCTGTDTALHCTDFPRSDGHPVGICKNAPQSQIYYQGFLGLNEDCYFCMQRFGEACQSEALVCSAADADCSACGTNAAPNPVGESGSLAEARPVCKRPVANACKGLVGPSWTDITNADPYNEIGAISCAGYFFGIVDNKCYERANVAANETLCRGNSEYDTAANTCPSVATAKNTAYTDSNLPNYFCKKAASGCSGTTPPVAAMQSNGEDLFGDCNDTRACTGSTNYYYGLVDDTPGDGMDNPWCFFAANVSNNACNGSGTCQTTAQACLFNPGQGDKDTASRGSTICHYPDSGCSGATAPTYNGLVAVNTDPYNDCLADDCDGAGLCQVSNGTSCTYANHCISGFCTTSNTDNVCCDEVCAGTCRACTAGKKNDGTLSGTCGNIRSGDDPDSECSGSYSCSAYFFGIVDVSSDGRPLCYLRADVSDRACNGSGACQSQAEACGASSRSSSSQTRQICTLPTSGCSGTTGATYTNIPSDTDPYGADCAGTLNCNGAGACQVPQGTECTANFQCPGGIHCVDGHCCNTACGGTCMSCNNGSGTCSSVTNATDLDSCAGTCNGSGNCVP